MYLSSTSFRVNQEKGMQLLGWAVVGTNVDTRLQNAANRSRNVAQRRVWINT
jgi:hypothetical protein